MCYLVLRVQPQEWLASQKEKLASADSAQDPPVPMPNTEVKLSSAENTWMETSWEDREVLAFVYSPIAQSVERVTVNHDVVGSSPTWGAKTNLSESYTYW